LRIILSIGGTMLLKRYEKNPILEPIIEHPWESVVVFNTAALLLENKIYLLYRARGYRGGISRIGYAMSKDGYHIDERLDKPIFGPDPLEDKEAFGCEDPRLTQIGDTIYMTYTAYGCVPGMMRDMKWAQLAITSISVKDFLAKKWNWSERIYPFPFTDNKDAVLFPEKIKGKYVMYHRIPQHIWAGYSDDMRRWYNNSIVMMPNGYSWEYYKLGAGAPPIKTEKGWLFIYHAVDNRMYYRLGLAFMDFDNPEKIIYKHPEPILEPGERYEKTGDTSNVVFTCGAVVKDDILFVYYGAADTVIGVATCPMKDILKLF
jgi:predicted GH43/DUF377 family glycosyl hydrolase